MSGQPDNMEYLGDGVYVVWLGFGVELRANHHEHPTDTIYMEPDVLQALNEFVERKRQEERNE